LENQSHNLSYLILFHFYFNLENNINSKVTIKISYFLFENLNFHCAYLNVHYQITKFNFRYHHHIEMIIFLSNDLDYPK
jgi:hypothetical protein